jgi:N-acetyl-gamma-glutamyl-phosphate/LysW-gamma-L-alpha-aminoadipyl-6-phosphate reductase
MARAGEKKAGVGVVGGSGYIGSELLRYLAIHPRVEIRWASARTKVGASIAEVLPNLRGFVEGSFISLPDAERTLEGIDCLFVALPHNESQDLIPRLAEAHPDLKFIDMGGDFRTDDPAGYAGFYQRTHAAPQWLSRFVYGFTEFQRAKLDGARLIANPGCFATSILLALAPLAARGRLAGPLFLSGVTGSSGAGNAPAQTTHHPERASNFRAYKPLEHQHLLEVESFLRALTPADFEIHFVPHSGPFVRGIFTTAFLPGVRSEELEEIYRTAYRGEPLISVARGSPDLRWVQSTPRSQLGVAGDEGMGVAFVAIDNLGKGAAGQAIQNFNRAMGFPETEGLLVPGGFV